MADLRRFDQPADVLHAGAELRVVSTGGPGRRSALATESDRAALRRGIQAFTIGPHGDLSAVVHHDLCAGSSEETSVSIQPLRDQVDTAAGTPVLLVVHDSATCGTPLDPLFEDLPVTRWRDLGFREPYVALLSPDLEDAVFEARGDRFAELRAVLRGPAASPVEGTSLAAGSTGNRNE